MGRRLDLTNKQFELLTAIQFQRVEKGHRIWLCKCACGNFIEIAAGYLNAGDRRSCGCNNSTRKGIKPKKPQPTSKKKITLRSLLFGGFDMVEDLIGQKIGLLTVIKPSTRKYHWMCQCECSEVVERSSGNLKRKDKLVKSCGCYKPPKRFAHTTPEQQAEIFAKYQADTSVPELMEEYSLNQHTVYRIIQHHKRKVLEEFESKARRCDRLK